MKTYLADFNDEDWVLDKEGVKDEELIRLVRHLADNSTSESAILIVLMGYEELRRRHPEYSIAECFDTSMVWYFG